MSLLAAGLGAIVGLLLGLTGAGGSIFAVPLLMWGMHWTLPQSVPVALLAVCAAATFGTVVAWDVTHIRYRAAILMSACGILLAPWGLRAAKAMPVNMLTGIFAGVLLFVAVRLIHQARKTPSEAQVVRAIVDEDQLRTDGPICRLSRDEGRFIWTRPCAVVVATAGALTGFLSGLLGVGGGFVIVPVLRTVTEVPIHSAIATSLMTIALTSAGALAVALWQGHAMPWLIGLPFIVGALVGMLIGRKLAPRIAGPKLQQVFAVLMFAVAIGLLVQAA